MTNHKAEIPEYLTTMEAAEKLRMSRRTLEKMRLTGSGPSYFKLGRLVVYSSQTLQEWVEGGRRRSTSDPGPAR